MTKILLKRGIQTKVDATSLSLGEPAFATDTKNFYIGDGVSKIKINGTTDHSALTKLDFASSGHTGFAPLDNPSFTTKISLTPSSTELLNFQTLSLKYQSTKGSIALNNSSAGIDTYSSVFLGTDSGTAITNSGYNNVAVGRYAMQNSVSPVYSVAVGNGSLRNANGANNVAIGAYSSESNTSANNTVAIGYGSLRSNSSGNANIAIGSDALKNISTGIGNIGIGLSAGAVKKSGGLSSSNASSIYIGNDAKASDDTSPSNEIVIGSSAVSNGSNSITLGQNSSMPLYIGSNKIYDGNKILKTVLPATSYMDTKWANSITLQVDEDGSPYSMAIIGKNESIAAFLSVSSLSKGNAKTTIYSVSDRLLKINSIAISISITNSTTVASPISMSVMLYKGTNLNGDLILDQLTSTPLLTIPAQTYTVGTSFTGLAKNLNLTIPESVSYAFVLVASSAATGSMHSISNINANLNVFFETMS